MKHFQPVQRPNEDFYEPSFKIPLNEHEIIPAHVRLIEQLDVINSSSLGLYNLQKAKYEYLSPVVNLFKNLKIEQGYCNPNTFYELLHPDDRELITKNQTRFLNFLYNQPIDQRKKYKLCEDFRMKDTKDVYIRLLSQLQVLELDLAGNIWLTIDTVDLSPDIDIYRPSNSILVNLETRERMNFSEPNHVKISKREKEILQLLSKGASSKEISNRLFISINTVNNHRKNIIQKLNVANIAQAVRLGATLGII